MKTKLDKTFQYLSGYVGFFFSRKNLGSRGYTVDITST